MQKLGRNLGLGMKSGYLKLSASEKESISRFPLIKEEIWLLKSLKSLKSWGFWKRIHKQISFN